MLSQALAMITRPSTPLLHIGEQLVQRRVAPRLRAELHHAAVFLRRGRHHLPFHKVVAVGLFGVAIFARLAGVNRRQGVPMIGRAEHEGVDLLVVERATIVADRFGTAIEFALELSLSRAEDRRVDVADVFHVDVFRRTEAIEEIVAAPFDAGATNGNPAVRQVFGPGTRTRREQRTPGDGDAGLGGVREKFAAIHRTAP